MKFYQFGYGAWGQNHNRILKELGHEVREIDLEQGGSNYPRIFAESTHPDAVIVTTSSVNHWDLTQYCLDRRIPVFCEKPVLLKPYQLKQLEQYAADPSIRYMSGHQLIFMEEVRRLDDVVYMNSMRSGGIPREEGALFSLMVHDIAMAHHTMGVKEFECLSAEGNKHELRAVLKNGYRTVDLYAVSVSRVRFRDTTFITADGSLVAIRPDNWNRVDLLKEELCYFIDSITNEQPILINGLEQTLQIMKTVFTIQAQLH